MSTDTQHFSLRWNNYLRHITRAFDSLRSEDNFVDVTLSCEGRQIRAHKMLLSACSTYFRDLFKENPCQHPIIILKNVRFEDLEALVEFIYQGEVNVVQDQLTSFLTTAELLAVQGLTNDSSKEVEEPPEEVSLEPPRPSKSRKSLPETRTPSPSTSRSSRKRRRTQNSEQEASIKQSIVEEDDDDVTFVPVTMPNLKVEIPEYIDNNAEQPIEHTNVIEETADNSCETYEQNDVKNNDVIDIENMVYEAQGVDLTGTEMSHMLDNPGTSDNLQDPSLQDYLLISIKSEANFENESLKTEPNFSNETITPEQNFVIESIPTEPNFIDEEKCFPCTICGKVYKRYTSLLDHGKLHMGKTTCPFCLKVFCTVFRLKKHMEAKHKNEQNNQTN